MVARSDAGIVRGCLSDCACITYRPGDGRLGMTGEREVEKGVARRPRKRVRVGILHPVPF
ncbi:hypothetical protein BD626DRAFT_510051 [Schizophyllum amplum]|uniref:Uncharacterized protein n=1 Tax=Schizophyllum amplum TaxID=97359 RepID=A0A550C2E9_9AGAR|nr:hypothetical protein BD626DRAFT_510051 [Auriculariopsis ampla]